MTVLTSVRLISTTYYQVDHFVRPGETMSSSSYQQVLGGKGANHP